MAKIFEFICKNCENVFTRTKGQVTSSTNAGRQISFCSKECKVKFDKKETKTINCSFCNKEITMPKNRLERSKNIYCNNECKSKHKIAQRPTYVCEYCNISFSRKKSVAEKAQHIFCSNSCKFNAKKDSIKTNCDFCKKEIEVLNKRKSSQNKIYCSYECMGKDKKQNIEVFCSECNKQFFTTKYKIEHNINNFCSEECRLIFSNKNRVHLENYTLDLAYKKLLERLRGCKAFLDWRTAVRKKYDFKCNECNATTALHAHHIKSLYSIAKKYNFIYEDIKKSPEFNDIENGVLLCSKCHNKKH